METYFFLLNHVSCEANADETIKGRVPYALNEKGLQEIEQLLAALEAHSFDYVLSSDLSPVLEMAERVAKQLNLPLVITPDVRIRYSGMWAGKAVEFVRRIFAKTEETPGREDPLSTTVRMISATKKIAREYKGKKILWVVNSSSTAAIDAYFNHLDNDPSLQKREKIKPFSTVFSIN